MLGFSGLNVCRESDLRRNWFLKFFNVKWVFLVKAGSKVVGKLERREG